VASDLHQTFSSVSWDGSLRIEEGNEDMQEMDTGGIYYLAVFTSRSFNIIIMKFEAACNSSVTLSRSCCLLIFKLNAKSTISHISDEDDQIEDLVRAHSSFCDTIPAQDTQSKPNVNEEIRSDA
jgi:hypothetical protein